MEERLRGLEVEVARLTRLMTEPQVMFTAGVSFDRGTRATVAVANVGLLPVRFDGLQLVSRMTAAGPSAAGRRSSASGFCPTDRNGWLLPGETCTFAATPPAMRLLADPVATDVWVELHLDGRVLKRDAEVVATLRRMLDLVR